MSRRWSTGCVPGPTRLGGAQVQRDRARDPLVGRVVGRVRRAVVHAHGGGLGRFGVAGLVGAPVLDGRGAGSADGERGGAWRRSRSDAVVGVLDAPAAVGRAQRDRGAHRGPAARCVDRRVGGGGVRHEVPDRVDRVEADVGRGARGLGAGAVDHDGVRRVRQVAQREGPDRARVARRVHVRDRCGAVDRDRRDAIGSADPRVQVEPGALEEERRLGGTRRGVHRVAAVAGAVGGRVPRTLVVDARVGVVVTAKDRERGALGALRVAAAVDRIELQGVSSDIRAGYRHGRAGRPCRAVKAPVRADDAGYRVDRRECDRGGARVACGGVAGGVRRAVVHAHGGGGQGALVAHGVKGAVYARWSCPQR